MLRLTYGDISAPVVTGMRTLIVINDHDWVSVDRVSTSGDALLREA